MSRERPNKFVMILQFFFLTEGQSMLPLTQFRVLRKENQSQGLVTTKEVQIARSHRAIIGTHRRPAKWEAILARRKQKAGATKEISGQQMKQRLLWTPARYRNAVLCNTTPFSLLVLEGPQVSALSSRRKQSKRSNPSMSSLAVPEPSGNKEKTFS